MPLKNLELLPFTEKALEELKSTSRGDLREAFYSEQIHRTHTPLLISSKLLRVYGCGQIDIATYRNGRIIIFEVKSDLGNLRASQRKRLAKSLTLVTSILDCSGRIMAIK